MITIRTWKRICYTILAVLVPFWVAVALVGWLDLDATTVRVLFYSTMLIWLALIWWPRKAA